MSAQRTAKTFQAWAMFTRGGHLFFDSVRGRRFQVVEYADADAAPGWDWKRYRRNGFYIAKVEIRSLTGGGNG